MYLYTYIDIYKYISLDIYTVIDIVKRFIYRSSLYRDI